MKKILSVLLVLCMLASSVLVLGSCSKKDKDAKNDPFTEIAAAFGNSASAFFGDAAAQKVMDKASQKGSFDITLASDTLMGGLLTEINEVIYIDSKNNTAVSDTALTIDKHKYNATLWGDKDGLAIKSESIFGNDDTLRLNLDSFIKNFEDSGLMDYLKDSLGMPEEASAELLDMIASIGDMMDEEKASATEKELEVMMAALYEILGHTETEAEMAGMDGKETKHKVVTFTLDNESLDKLCKLVLEYIEKNADTAMIASEELITIKTTLNEALNQLDAMMSMEIKATFNINTKGNTLTSSILEAKLIPLENESQKIEASLEVAFTAEAFTVKAGAKVEGVKYAVDISVDKKTEGDTVTYEMVGALKTGNVKMDLFSATYMYDKKAGEIEFKGTVSLNENDSAEINLKALYKVTDTEITFELDALEISSDSEVFFKMSRGDELKIVITAGEDAPVMDEDATDIMDMGAKDWERLVASVMESDLGQLLGNLGGGDVEGLLLYGTYVSEDSYTSLIFDGASVTIEISAFGQVIASATGTYTVYDNAIEFDFGNADDLVSEWNDAFSFQFDGDTMVISGENYNAA